MKIEERPLPACEPTHVDRIRRVDAHSCKFACNSDPLRGDFRVELWDRHDQHIRRVIAASASVAVGHAALDVAIATYPGERFTLRNGIQVIREHVPKSAP